MPITEKVEILVRVRELIEQQVPEAVESNRVEGDLLAITFQSKVHPERHVWIDVYNTRDTLAIDLEDWTVEGEWDNAVERLTVLSVEAALEVVRHWLA